MSPQIPTFVSKKELTTEPGAVLVKPEKYGIKGDQGKILQAVGETLTKVGAKFQEIQDTNEYTTAQIETAKKLNDARIKAESDPDIWNAGKTFESEITKIPSDIKIGNQLVKNKFMAEFEIDKMNATNKLNDHLRTKQLEQTSATALSFIDTKEREYPSSSYAVQAIIKAQIKDKYDEMVRLGAWKADAAYKEWAKTESDLRTGQVDFDTNIDAIGTLAELKKGKAGMYPDLTSDERTKLIDSTEIRIRRDQLIYAFQDNQKKDKNEASLLVEWADGKLTEQHLKDSLSNLDIRRPFAERMFKKIYDDPNVETDYSTYIKIRQMQLTNAPASEINQAILDNGDKLSNADKKGLINKTFSETDKQQKAKIKYNVDALKIWSIRNLSTPKNDLSSDVIYEFHRRVNNENAQGNKIDEIAQEVIKDKIKEYYPSTSLMNDVPNFIVERNSLKRVYEKSSKLKGKVAPFKPSVVTGGAGIDFDDL